MIEHGRWMPQCGFQILVKSHWRPEGKLERSTIMVLNEHESVPVQLKRAWGSAPTLKRTQKKSHWQSNSTFHISLSRCFVYHLRKNLKPNIYAQHSSPSPLCPNHVPKSSSRKYCQRCFCRYLHQYARRCIEETHQAQLWIVHGFHPHHSPKQLGRRSAGVQLLFKLNWFLTAVNLVTEAKLACIFVSKVAWRVRTSRSVLPPGCSKSNMGWFSVVDW